MKTKSIMKKSAIYLFILFLSPTSILFAQNFQKGKITALTDGTVKFTEAKWSPDGNKVAFTKQGHVGIYVADLKNSIINELVDDLGAGYKFAWSPNSKEIAYRANEFEDNKRSQYIAIVNCNTLDKQIIVEKQPIINQTPKYTIENGNQVLLNVIGREVDRTQKKAAHNHKIKSNKFVDVIFKDGDIYSITALGDELQLTNNGRSVYPVMSPDKSKVVISSNDELIIMNLDGTKKVNLGQGYHPSFSPDGQYIVYHIATDDGYNITSSDLFITDINGNEKTQLTNTPNQIEEFPDWSPSGNELIFNDLISGVIYKMELK